MEQGGQVVKSVVLKRLGPPECLETMEMKDGRDTWWHDFLEGTSPEVSEVNE